MSLLMDYLLHPMIETNTCYATLLSVCVPCNLCLLFCCDWLSSECCVLDCQAVLLARKFACAVLAVSLAKHPRAFSSMLFLMSTFHLILIWCSWPYCTCLWEVKCKSSSYRIDSLNVMENLAAATMWLNHLLQVTLHDE